MWVDELLEATHRQARVATKQGAKLESALSELEARMVSLQTAPRAPVSSAPTLHLDAIFDALDGLDAACALATDAHLREGLTRVSERLEGFCAAHGYTRQTGLGAAPDGRLMRVVGSEPHADVPTGHVARVVRAAFVRAGQVVREGSVIVSRGEQDHG